MAFLSFSCRRQWRSAIFAACFLPLFSLVTAVEEKLIIADVRIERRDPGQNYFTNPPPSSILYDYNDDPIYHVGDTLNITWETAWPFVDVILCQPAVDQSYGEARIKANTSSLWYAWDVTESDVTTLAGPVGEVFFFIVRPASAATPWFQSHYFNVSNPSPGEGPATINNPGSTTPSNNNSTDSSPSKSANSTNPASSSSSQSEPASSSGHSSSGVSKVGVGSAVAISIGAAVVASAIAAVLTWWLCVAKKRRRMQRLAAEAANNGKLHSSTSSTNTFGSIYGPSGFVRPVEVPADDAPREIGGPTLSHEVEAKEMAIELPAWIEPKEDRRSSAMSSVAASTLGSPRFPQEKEEEATIGQAR